MFPSENYLYQPIPRGSWWRNTFSRVCLGEPCPNQSKQARYEPTAKNQSTASARKSLVVEAVVAPPTFQPLLHSLPAILLRLLTKKYASVNPTEQKTAKFVGKNFLLRMTHSRKFTCGRRKESTLVLSSFPWKGCSSRMIRNAEWNIDGGHIDIPSIIFQSVFFENVCPFHKNTNL